MIMQLRMNITIYYNEVPTPIRYVYINKIDIKY